MLFTTEKLIVDADDVRDDVIQAVQQTSFKLYDINAAKLAAKKRQDNPFSEYNSIIILFFLMLISWGISLVDDKIGQIAFNCHDIIWTLSDYC